MELKLRSKEKIQKTNKTKIEKKYKEVIVEIEIRRLVAADYDGYIELSDQLDEYHRIALPQYFKKPQEQFRPLEEYLKLIADPAFLINGAFAGAKLVGYFIIKVLVECTKVLLKIFR